MSLFFMSKEEYAQKESELNRKLLLKMLQMEKTAEISEDQSEQDSFILESEAAHMSTSTKEVDICEGIGPAEGEAMGTVGYDAGEGMGYSPGEGMGQGIG